MVEECTLAELVAEAAASIETLPPPKNGQVRAVPDERTVRYYGTLGLLDRPLAMRGRTALYGRRHLAQVVAIKRLQSAGRSLAEIQAMWPGLDDATLERMSGIDVAPRRARKEFWRAPVGGGATAAAEAKRIYRSVPPGIGARGSRGSGVELRIDLAPGAVLVVAVPASTPIASADVHAIRAAAASLVTELARCGLTQESS